jgi:SAM-dependent MidA family methyltransferase
MELALYYPGLGYYERPSKHIGCHGDFYTSVSVSSVFGELLAFQFAEWINELIESNASDPSTMRFQLVEAGAHDGRLAADVLRWFRQFRADLERKIEYWILEPSDERRAWQEKSLAEFERTVRWHDAWATLPSKVHGVIFSNELLDAFPVHRLGWRRTEQHWFEWGVSCKGDEFDWKRLDGWKATASIQETKLDTSLYPSLPAELLAVLPDGFTTECSPAATGWWQQAAQALGQGKLVTFDYGLNADEFFLPKRSDGTLRAYRDHCVCSNVLADPGHQDLTTCVNFSDLVKAGESQGLVTETFSSGAQFLAHIFERTMAFDGKFPKWAQERLRQFKTLVHPEHLGRSYKVLVQSR